MRREDFTDVRYEVADGGIAVGTIDRPDRMNSFRGRTVDELLSAFTYAWADGEVTLVGHGRPRPHGRRPLAAVGLP